MEHSILFQLPPELLCGLCSRLPGEDLRHFSTTCRRLKELADQTAVGRIAYLLRKRDPMWARLHKGAVRQGLRSASAILAFMETNLHKAKTKTRLPTVVKLDTGNNYHSLEHVDDLKKVDLFDDKKVELDFKIGNNIAAAAFFTSLPTLALYQWDLVGSPQQAKQSDIWIRRPNRNILVDLSMYDIFDNGPENVILGTLQISGNFIALYLPCMDIILIFDINTQGGIEVQVIELDFDFEAFLGFYVVHDRHYFIVEEVSDDLNCTVFVRDHNNNLQLYTRVENQAFSFAKVHEDLYVTTLNEDGTEFYLVKFEKDDPFERSLKLDPIIKNKTNQCQFTLEVVCDQVLAICKCSGHIISYDLSNWRNTNSNYILDMDTKLDMPSIPSKGIDYVIHFGQKKHNFFDRMGTWFRIWYSSSKSWKWGPNRDVKLPSDLDGNISIFSTFIHSRSNCALIYDYFPVTEDNSAMSINLFF